MYLYICMNVCACSRGPGLVCSVDRDSPNINRTIQLDNQPQEEAITNDATQ